MCTINVLERFILCRTLWIRPLILNQGVLRVSVTNIASEFRDAKGDAVLGY